MNQASKYIDLTHTLSKTIPSWNGDCGFHLNIHGDYKDSTGPDFFRSQDIAMRAGMGTHMDAPAHCFEGAKTIDELKLENLVVDCVMIDVSADANETYIVMPEVVEKFEKEHGEIKPNSVVIFYTGWDKYWDTPEKYINNHIFPSIHEDTAQLLLKRDIAGLGIDTLSADTGATGFPVHRAILGAGKYLIENVANAKQLPSTGAKVCVMPIKIKDGTESPIRLIALV